MFSRASKGLVLALSLAASTFAVGCAGEASEDVASDEGAATASNLATGYEGTIGNLKVLVRLEAQGSNVTGSYFYSEKTGNGDTLVLKGTTSGAKITLSESVNGAGAATGTFDGTISSTGITGTWKAGNRTLPLKLTAIKTLKTFQHKYAATAPKSKEEYARQCSLEAEVTEVYGVSPALAKSLAEALKVDALDKAPDGTCDSDIRYVTQSVKLNAGGFLTIHVATEWDGGAHPENGSEYYNFNVATGKQLGPNDFLLPSSEAKIKELIEKQLNAQPDLSAEEKKDAIESFREHYTEETKVEHIQMGFGEKGLTIDMGNNYPHVILALAPMVEVPWADLKSILNPAAGLSTIAK